MAETFHTLIARNKRNSWLLIAAFMLFFVVFGGLIGYVAGSYWGGGGTTRTVVDEQGRRRTVRVESPQPQPYPWSWSIAVAVGAAGVAFVLTLFSYYGGSGTLLALSKAKPLRREDDPQLYNVVEELCIAGGLPLPKIYMIEDTAMNAFATGRDPQHAVVAITHGLREKLSRDELQGVMAHELSHVRHYDILYAMLVAVMVGVTVMLADVFLRSVWFMGGSRRGDRDRGGGNPAQAILLVLAIVLAILAPILARIIQMALSRQREYLADAGSVELTRHPQGLASALAKLAGDTEVLEVANRATAPLYIVHPIKRFEERAKGIFETHPPIQDRIARLMSLTR